MTGTILVVDDERNIRRTLRLVLEGAGFEVLEAESAEAALELLGQHDVDVVILDVRLPGKSGIEALAEIRSQPATARLPVLVISGHATLAEAVHAVQQGATDFFEKPLDRDRVLVSVRNAVRAAELEREVRRLREAAFGGEELLGDSAVMRRLFSDIEKVAPTRGRVLIVGESGTGKELVAKAIHRLSPRASGPFVKVNCAAIPSELIESELFGHERGAFTGASQRKRGVFELAHGGTLLLDEIGDMHPSAQAKVLRALQSGEITRVGSERPISVDVRVLAATNKDLEAEVAAGRFREDLYFRLAVVPLRCPPLRERPEDIPLLVHHFLDAFCRDNGMPPKPIDDDALEALRQHPWPGNVRQLRNVVERLAILSDDRITLDDVLADAPPGAATPAPAGRADDPVRPTLRQVRERAEREHILATLDACGWNISRAAGLLGLERTHLHKKMRAYGIRRPAQESQDD